MCHIIESNFILIHQLRTKSSCSISDLVQRKTLLKEEFLLFMLMYPKILY